MKLEKSITLNGWSVDLMSPNKVFSFALTLILPWLKYSPTGTIQENYLKCFQVGVQYSKFILKEKEYYVGKRGWNMANSFIYKAKKKEPIIKNADRNKLISLIFNDIFVSEGLVVRDTSIFIPKRVYPKDEIIPALTRATYGSKRLRVLLTFNDKWESEKIRNRIIIEENNSKEELENGKEENSQEKESTQE